MKTKLKKYLSGSREGFSLVELIIVIAIMAILIGVVALAVIPYLAKSRESKDLQTLDTVCSALSSAVASSQVSGSGDFTYGTAPSDAEELKVYNAMTEVLGSGSTKLTSKNATSASIHCVYDATNNTIFVYADNSGCVELESNETGYSKDTSATNGLKTEEGGKALVVSN
jgi:type IV pilus assembly protein PilA